MSDLHPYPLAAAPPHPDDRDQFAGLRLRIAQGLWFAVAAIALALTVTGAPARYQHLLTSADVRSLAPLGLSPQAYATYLTGLDLVSLLAHLVTAAYIFWRRPAHRMCLLVSFALITNGGIVPFSLFFQSVALAPVARLFVNLMLYLGLSTSIVLLYLFPNGKFVPHWTRPLAWLWALLVLAALFVPQSPFSLPRWPLALQFLVLLAWAGTGVFAQVFRYLNISSPTQRQQAKWAGLGLGAAVFGPLAYFLPFVILPALTGPAVPNFLFRRVGAGFFALSLATELASRSLFTLALTLFPVLFAVAILRYRLWDIDLLINRTLVYATLTALLALAYFTSIVLLQEPFRAITGQSQSPLVTVLSTLLIAAIASPLRRRIQDVIDRRFYRRKYDAVRTLTTFSATVRDDVDLDTLSSQLLSVVDETMQPAHASLWLRPPAPTAPPPP